MVFKLQLRCRDRFKIVKTGLLLFLAAVFFLNLTQVIASDETKNADELLLQARKLAKEGQYFQSARMAFTALEGDSPQKPMAYAMVTEGLVRAGLFHSGAYFFIRTLQSKDRTAIKAVLKNLEELLEHVDVDLVRPYLIHFASTDDVDAGDKSAYSYVLGKHALLQGKEEDALKYLSFVSRNGRLWPFALQLMATANAILGRDEQALKDFMNCEESAESMSSVSQRQARDLAVRCIAGQARTLYQMNHFRDAELVYDRIPKSSIVWPDILFEQAWNAYAAGQYNRTLGKLVSYKSPVLSSVFNPEIDVLAAQTYLELCLYTDANSVVNEFNVKYGIVGNSVKQFIEKNASRLTDYYMAGRDALNASIYTDKDVFKLMNRFVRGPYFQRLVFAEKEIESENNAIAAFSGGESDTVANGKRGFAGFLRIVLKWRLKTVKVIGGAFVKNSLLDYYSKLLSDFEKINFIKLEMLNRAKARLTGEAIQAKDRIRGDQKPNRIDDQYYWDFNGEFWSDEMGDYVFGLESKCKF